MITLNKFLIKLRSFKTLYINAKGQHLDEKITIKTSCVFVCVLNIAYYLHLKRYDDTLGITLELLHTPDCDSIHYYKPLHYYSILHFAVFE